MNINEPQLPSENVQQATKEAVAQIRRHEIMNEIVSWATRNFPAPTPMRAFERTKLGLIEENGEIVHCILKREQNIRSQDTSDAQLRDGIGDAAIYLLHGVGTCPWLHHAPERTLKRSVVPTADPITPLLFLAQRISTWTLTPSRDTADRVWEGLDDLAQIFDWDLDQILEETWAIVQKRDWVANPATGAAQP